MIAGGLLWDELVEIRHHWDIPWCCIGDFDVIRFPSERLGCTSFLSAMLDFSQFIEDLSLIDLPLEGGNLLGLVALIILQCPRLIGRWFLQIGKSICRRYCRFGFVIEEVLSFRFKFVLGLLFSFETFMSGLHHRQG